MDKPVVINALHTEGCCVTKGWGKEVIIENNELYCGKLLCFNNDELYPSPNPQETIDVSGAGDTFTSAFILKYLETDNIKSSIIYANEMASVVVSKRGVATP